MPTIFIYPIIPALVFGTLNYWYWKKKGFESKTQWAMNILIFYTGFYLLIKKLYF